MLKRFLVFCCFILFLPLLLPTWALMWICTPAIWAADALSVPVWRFPSRLRTRHIDLFLDADDFDAIQNEFAKRQARDRWKDGGVILPDGTSNLAGALVAEAIRDLDEYRSIYDAKRS